MNLQELIQDFEARGITLLLRGKDLHYTAKKPIPPGIVTTIEAHRGRLKKHLEAKQDDTDSKNDTDSPDAAQIEQKLKLAGLKKRIPPKITKAT